MLPVVSIHFFSGIVFGLVLLMLGAKCGFLLGHLVLLPAASSMPQAFHGCSTSDHMVAGSWHHLVLVGGQACGGVGCSCPPSCSVGDVYCAFGAYKQALGA